MARDSYQLESDDNQILRGIVVIVTRWAFSEGRNSLNAASHCDIAWAGALATHAHLERPFSTGCLVAFGYGDGVNEANAAAYGKLTPEQRMLLSDDPRIWGRWGR